MTLATRIDRRAADRYASAVARHLRHLPRPQRRRLVDDLRAHLLELPGGSDLQEVLGSPRAYAAELLRSSGLPEPRGFRAWLRRVPLPVKIAVPVLLLLAVAGTVFGIWISGYEPVEFGSSWFTPGVQPDPVLGDQANIVIDYQHDARYRFGFSLHNGGRLPVEIVDFPVAGFASAPFVVEQVVVDRPHSYDDAGATPFQPFTLEPDEDRGFAFRGVLAHCADWAGGASASFDSIKVKYRVLGITKMRDIPLRQPIAVRFHGYNTPQCPYTPPPQEGPINGNGTQVLDVLHGGNFLEVQLIASRAPTGELSIADWTVPTPCDDTPPAGYTDVPVALVANRDPDPYNNYTPVPIDLRFRFPNGSSGGRVLVAAADTSLRCRAADAVHIETLDEGDIAVIDGVVEVPTGTCGAQQIEISSREDNGWHRAGTARLDIPCSVSG